jgi:two-component system, OmpR family, copper resistance phosphate regulon response regulator CusR
VRILLVEDETRVAALLAKGLREHAHAVDVAEDGDRALEEAAASEYDLVILDVLLPGRSGLEVCRELRAHGCAMPILMLTARDAVDQRVEGLDAGADDYLTKPFDFEELLARVRALGRRGRALQRTVLEVGDLLVDTRARRAARGGRVIDLTSKEYALLEFMARRAGEVLGRADIAEHVWDSSFDPFSNLIEVYVQRLRRKIDDGHAVKLIHTRRGAGYFLQPADGDD